MLNKLQALREEFSRLILLMKAKIMMDKWMMMMMTCFTVSKGGTKESGGVAAKSKKVEDHRCHRVCLFLVVRIVRLEKIQR